MILGVFIIQITQQFSVLNQFSYLSFALKALGVGKLCVTETLLQVKLTIVIYKALLLLCGTRPNEWARNETRTHFFRFASLTS